MQRAQIQSEDGGQAIRRGVLLVLVSAVAFGALPIFAKLAYREGLNLNTLLALRFTMAAAIMWIIWAYQRRKAVEARPVIRKAQILPLVAMGAIGYVGQSFSYFTAVGIISATTTTLLLYTYPTLVTLLAWLLFKEQISGQKLAALALAGLGTLMVLGIFSSLLSGRGGALGELQPAGVAWALAAAVIYSAYIIAGSRYTTNVSPVYSSAVIISAASAAYVAWGALSGDINLSVSALGLLWTAGLAIVSTVIAITTFFAGLPSLGPSRASIISTLEPAVTVALAALILQETIAIEQLLGGALILLAIVTLQVRAGKQRKQLKSMEIH